MPTHRTASLLSVLIPGEDNSPNPVSRKFPVISDQLLCGTVLLGQLAKPYEE